MPVVATTGAVSRTRSWTCPLLRRQVQFLDLAEICPLLRRQVQFLGQGRGHARCCDDRCGSRTRWRYARCCDDRCSFSDKVVDMPFVATTGAVLGHGGDMPVVATTGAVSRTRSWTCPLLRRQVRFSDTVEICPLLRRQVQFLGQGRGHARCCDDRCGSRTRWRYARCCDDRCSFSDKVVDMPFVATTGAVLGHGGDMPVVATTGAVSRTRSWTCPLLRRQVQFLDTVEICPLLRRQVQFLGQGRGHARCCDDRCSSWTRWRYARCCDDRCSFSDKVVDMPVVYKDRGLVNSRGATDSVHRQSRGHLFVQ